MFTNLSVSFIVIGLFPHEELVYGRIADALRAEGLSAPGQVEVIRGNHSSNIACRLQKWRIM